MSTIPAHKTLRFKLFVFISLMLVMAIAVSAFQSGHSFRDMLMMRIQEKALQSARTAANGVASVVEAWTGQLVMLTTGVSGMPQSKYEEMVRILTATNPDFLTLEILTVGSDGTTETVVRSVTARADDERLMGREQADVVKKLRSAYLDSLKKAAGKPAKFLVKNISGSAGLPILFLAQPFPVRGSSSTAWGVLTVWQTKLFAALSMGASENVRVFDRGGDLLAASDVGQILGTVKAGASPFPQAFSTSATAQGFKQWEVGDQVTLGAYARVPGFDLVAITETDGAPAYEAVRQVLTRTGLWAVFLVLLSVFFSYLAASGTTRNLQRLTQTTLEIASGRFQAKVAVTSRDEVGLLGLAVNHLGAKIEGLLSERVEMARLEGELKTAKMVQDQFFPKKDVGHVDLRIVSFYQPASECGGDWWGHYEIAPRTHLLCLGDATGHGVPAALVTAMVFSAAHVLARQMIADGPAMHSPARLLTEFNRTLFESGKGVHTMTFFVAILDLDAGVLTYANASHNFPILLRHGEKVAGPRQTERSHRKELSQVGSPLGFDPNSAYEDKSVVLTAGDRLLLYTDGLYECTNAAKKQWGRRKFYKQIETANQLDDLVAAKDHIVSGAFSHFGGEPLGDDITVVMAEVSRDWKAKPVTVNPRLRLPRSG